MHRAAGVQTPGASCSLLVGRHSLSTRCQKLAAHSRSPVPGLCNIQGHRFASCRSTSRALAVTASMEGQIKEKNEKYPVMIYAKSYCPFCGQVKGLFNKLQVDYMSVNLDEIHEGEEIQDALVGITGSHTVPQVFVKGEFIGGCDDTMQLNSSGKLKEKLEKAGVEVKA